MSNGKTNDNRLTPRGAFGLKKSQFNAQTGVPDGSTFDYVSGGTNYKITFEDLAAAFEVTGTIVAGTESLTTPVLDKAGSVNTIRNLKEGSGIGLSITPENSIEIETAFTVDTTGAPVFNEATSPTTVRSITAASGSTITVGFDGQTIQIGDAGTPVTGKTIQVNSMSDFPDPVSGVITLSDDTNYSVNNDLSTSNRFVLGDRCRVAGADSLIITLTYTGTATMFTGSDVTATIANMTIDCPTGTFIDWENTAGNEGTDSIACEDLLITCDTSGTITSPQFALLRACQVIHTTDGMTIAGTNIGNLLVESSGFIGSAGTCIDLGTSVSSSVRIVTAEFDVDTGATGISGAGDSNITSGGLGRFDGVSFFGSGTYVSGITSSLARWFVISCVPIENSRTDGMVSLSGNTTQTVITATNTPVKANAVFTVELESRMTSDTTGRITYLPSSPENLPISALILMNKTGGGSADLLSAYLAINGTVVTQTKSQNDSDGTDNTSISLLWQHKFQQNDYVEIWVENQSDTSNIVLENVVFRVN